MVRFIFLVIPIKGEAWCSYGHLLALDMLDGRLLDPAPIQVCTSVPLGYHLINGQFDNLHMHLQTFFYFIFHFEFYFC